MVKTLVKHVYAEESDKSTLKAFNTKNTSNMAKEEAETIHNLIEGSNEQKFDRKDRNYL